MLIVVTMPASIFASDTSLAKTTSREYLEDGSYFETTLETKASKTSLFSTRASKYGKKTTAYKNSSNVTMWTVTVQGTFSYNGSSATCTRAVGSATSKSSNWKVSNIKSWKSGNAASASAVGKRYAGNTVVQTTSRTVVLKCNGKGRLY